MFRAFANKSFLKGFVIFFLKTKTFKKQHKLILAIFITEIKSARLQQMIVKLKSLPNSVILILGKESVHATKTSSSLIILRQSA